jgi:hypothetical protein
LFQEIIATTLQETVILIETGLFHATLIETTTGIIITTLVIALIVMDTIIITMAQCMATERGLFMARVTG